MEYGQLLHSLPDELRTLFRRLETTEKKILMLKWSHIFNNVCLDENIMPVYTKCRINDPAMKHKSDTLEYRKALIRKEINEGAKKKVKVIELKNEIVNKIEEFQCDSSIKNNVGNALQSILDNSARVQKNRILKKLNNLYRGQVVLKDKINSFINLSDHDITPGEAEFLNLGLNYHIQRKYDKLHKMTEIEMLYNKLLDLQKKNDISLDSKIVNELAAESCKHRNTKYISTVTPNLKKAAKGLKENKELIIRKADKSSIYVILNKKDYIEKLNNILADSSKFQKITRDPTNSLKKEANKLISTLNAMQGDIRLPTIIGDFSPGYIYGNVKIHKEGNPLRPIISQVPTPTYNLAKSLNQIITPFLPNENLLKSTNDFLDLLQDEPSTGIIASLDVESLFTNVPINDTIAIILEHAYNHGELPPPKIPKEILKQLLELCTKKAPFKSPTGDLYLQIEGVAMGSPLGPTFANYYMGHLERLLFSKPHIKPSIYGRYVDDIFVQVNDLDELVALKHYFQENSILNFTYELNVDNKLPFLDVLVESKLNGFETKVYHKPTSFGTCLNANSECPDRYKNSVVFNYLNRAYRICNTWNEFHLEVMHIKQMLVNNNYTNTTIDHLTNKFIKNKLDLQTQNNIKKIIPVFYQAQMHKNYKIDEKVLNDIVQKNSKCNDPSQKLKVIFYYNNPRTSNLVMKNNLTTEYSPLNQTNVVYQFTCPYPHRKADCYIGMTQTTLLRRMNAHAHNGSIFEHFMNEHSIKPTKVKLTENTTVIARADNRFQLAIKEALLILQNAPSINKQFDNFTNILKLRAHQNPNLNLTKNTIPLPSTSRDQSRVTLSGDEENVCNDSGALQTSDQFSSPYQTTNMYGNNTRPHSNSSTPTPFLSEFAKEIYTQNKIIDMNLVLAHFDINTDDCNVVPLRDYRWNEFIFPQHMSASDELIDDLCHSPRTSIGDADTSTISQRIKSMVRKARVGGTSNTTY